MNWSYLNSNISLVGLDFRSGNGINICSSGVKQCLICSGATEMSTFKVPLIHLSLFKTGLGLFRSCKNLYRSSSLSLSPSCLKKLDTVNVTGGNESNMAPTSPGIVNNQLPLM